MIYARFGQKILETCERVANIFLHPDANYTYMYNLHTVCKSAHVNGALHYIYQTRSTARQPTQEVGSIRCGSSKIQKNY